MDRNNMILTIWNFCIQAIGRTLIPRYFRSIFDGGVSELYFHLKLAKESFHNPTITLDCDQCTMVTHHTVKPMFTKVYYLHDTMASLIIINWICYYLILGLHGRSIIIRVCVWWLYANQILAYGCTKSPWINTKVRYWDACSFTTTWSKYVRSNV